MRKINLDNSILQKLGKIPDVELVEMSGLSLPTIYRNRINLGIKKAPRNNTKYRKSEHVVMGHLIYKKCSKCNTEKELENFRKSKMGWDGFRPECKECQSRYYRKYRQTAKGRLSETLHRKRRFNNSLKKDGGISRQDKLKLVQQFIDSKCPHCNCVMGGNYDKGSNKSYPTLGHKLPLKRGGDWSYENLQIECLGCNLKKSNLGNMTNSEYDEWLK